MLNRTMFPHFRREVSFLCYLAQHRLTQFISSIRNRNRLEQNVPRTERQARRRQQARYTRDVHWRTASNDSVTTSCDITSNNSSATSRSVTPRAKLSRKIPSLRIPDAKDDLQLPPRVIKTRKRSLLTVSFDDRLEQGHSDSGSWFGDGAEGQEESDREESEKSIQEFGVNEFGYFSSSRHSSIHEFGSEVSLTPSTIPAVMETLEESRPPSSGCEKVKSLYEESRSTSLKSKQIMRPDREFRSKKRSPVKPNKPVEKDRKDHKSVNVKASSLKTTITKFRNTIMGSIGIGGDALAQSNAKRIGRVQVSRYRQDDLVFSGPKKYTNGDLPHRHPDVGVAFGLVLRKEKMIRTKTIQEDSLIRRSKNDVKSEEVKEEKDKEEIANPKEVGLSHVIPEHLPASRGSTASALQGIRSVGEDGINWDSGDKYKTSMKFRRRLDTPRVLETVTSLTSDGVGAKSIARSFYPSTNYTSQFSHLLPNGRIGMDF